MNQQRPSDSDSPESSPREPSWRDHPGVWDQPHMHAGPPPAPPGPTTHGPGETAAPTQPTYGPYDPHATEEPAQPAQLGQPTHSYGAFHGPFPDPRQDPRWVHSPHESTHESRPIPYFSGYYAGPDHYYEQPRRRRGALSVLINGIGLLAFGFLLLGFLSLVFDWSPQRDSLEGLFTPQEEETQAAPQEPFDGGVQELVDQLDHAHEGIDVDWDAGGQHTGPGLDPGQEVTSAPGIFMVDTQVYQYLGFGTGMVLSPDGLAITNYHVVESSMSVSITMADSEERYSATVLGRDASRDIAVLQIDTDEPLPVTSINTGDVSLGDTVAGVGNSGGQGYLTSVVGEVRGLQDTIHIEPQEPGSPTQVLENLLRISADIVPGYSGGPTVDANGQVIAVSTAASQDTTNTAEAFGYAVPIRSALEVVEQVLTGDDSGDVVIGAGGALGIVVSSEPSTGARVMEVTNGSAAQNIGLAPDDVILAIDGQEVVNSSFISRYVRDKNPGDQVVVTWRSADGALQEATAVLDEASIN